MTNPNDHDPQADQVFVADPSTADIFDDEPILPKWPKVVGIMSIVWGALLTLCGAAAPAQGWLNTKTYAGYEGGVPDILLNPPVLGYVAAGIGIIGSLLLLVAGIMCTLRNSVARPLFLVYAVLTIASTIWAVSLQLDAVAEIQTWMNDNPDARYTQETQMVGDLIWILPVSCAAIFGLPWPAFCLIWFGFVKTKPDDFTGGANIEVL